MSEMNVKYHYKFRELHSLLLSASKRLNVYINLHITHKLNFRKFEIQFIWRTSLFISNEMDSIKEDMDIGCTDAYPLNAIPHISFK